MVTIQILELQHAASVVSSHGRNWCLNWEGGGGVNSHKTNHITKEISWTEH